MVYVSIYTKKGDKGQTGLLGGSRVNKSSLKVSCYGTLDEANASLGVAYSLIQNEELRSEIRVIQKMLFVIGAELASDYKGEKTLESTVQFSDVTNLENTIDYFDTIVGPLHEFIIPGDTTASAALHQSRSIIRRAERLVNELGQEIKVREEMQKYLNRLSDTIFMLARAEARLNFIDQVKNKVLQKLNPPKETFSLTLDMATQLAQEAEKYAREIGILIVFSVVDQGGNLMLFHRMEGSLLGDIDTSKHKAYSALAFKKPTHEIVSGAQLGPEPYSAQGTDEKEIVSIGGGYPLTINGQVVGGIGVSGGTVEQDIEVANQTLFVNEKYRES